jgi:hypothetical protein
VHLNKYLVIIGIVNFPLFPKSHKPESIEYYLLYCHHFVEETLA